MELEESSEKLVSIEGLTKYYGPFPAVKDVDIQVNRGEILGLIGPNGAGKSTIMKMLTGIISPTSGNGTIAGEPIFTRSSAVRSRVGYLMENPPIYPEIPVSSYLDICGRMKGLSKKERKEQIAHNIDLLALEEVKDRACGKLSKGFKQRVGVAQAMLGDPDVLILDEPISGLDPIQIIELREIIKKLSEGRSVIVSSHILQEVAQTCNRLLIICEGRTVASGTASELENIVLSGQDSLYLKVNGEADKIRKLLDSMENVKEFTVESSAMGTWLDVMVTLSGTSGRENLSSRIINEGIGLLEMRSMGMSLEEIFVRLTLGEE